MSLFIASSRYTYQINNEQACSWNADIYAITTNKEDIMNDMSNKVQEELDNYNLVWVFSESENENYYAFQIYEQNSRYNSADDYKNNWNNLWFWFIKIKVV